MIKNANDDVNKLVREFAADKFALFCPAGDSHLDFVVRPETAEIAQSKRLEAIRHDIWSYFLGAEWAKENPSAPMFEYFRRFAKPSELLGTDKVNLYRDMHLDIQVSGLTNY